jgi:hypothetical protein
MIASATIIVNANKRKSPRRRSSPQLLLRIASSSLPLVFGHLKRTSGRGND